MIKAQRQQRVLEVLRAEGAVDVASLARIMPEVSQVTLRRDVAELAEAGSLRRTHGGAVLPDAVLVRHPATQSQQSGSSGDISDFDAVILPPIPGRGGDALRRHITDRGIPFLAESAPQDGGNYLGPDNASAGRDLGRMAGAELQQFAHPRVLVIGHPELSNTRERVDGFLEGLRDGLGRDCDVVSVNGQGSYKTALRVALDAMASSGPFQAAFGVNDHSAIAIAEAAARGEQEIAIYATGGESAEFVGRLANRNRIRAIAAFFPERVGEQAIDVLANTLSGQPLPETVTTPYAILDADTLGDYFEQKDGAWQLKVARRTPLKPLKRRFGSRRPKVGFIPHFPAHDWYRQMIQSMQVRAGQHGLELVVIAPHKGISAEVTRLRREIARAACSGLAPGETILIGDGEAALLFAEEIRRTAYQEPERVEGLTIITNALDVLFQLENVPGVKALITSGEYQSVDRCLVGPSVGAIFERVRADRAYIAPAGLSRKFGLSSMDERLALAGSRLVDAARRTFVLADHTVVGADANHRVARIEDVDEVITDDGALPADRQSLRSAGILVRVAGDDGNEHHQSGNPHDRDLASEPQLRNVTHGRNQ
ncbi:MAG: substrate-binding domain-containing protein [Alphaproteobacteria bacterium]|nr:substrate-binding domain-containing protein [Alphaproteobacteria bacterium]